MAWYAAHITNMYASISKILSTDFFVCLQRNSLEPTEEIEFECICSFWGSNTVCNNKV